MKFSMKGINQGTISTKSVKNKKEDRKIDKA